MSKQDLFCTSGLQLSSLNCYQGLGGNFYGPEKIRFFDVDCFLLLSFIMFWE